MLREAEFIQISDAVYKHCGINLHDGKKELVQARIAKRLRESKYTSPSAYVEEVLSNPNSEEFGHLIDAISTNLTSFFRENGHFQYLVEQHLPRVIDRKRKVGTPTIRCWSAGCSTGEEPYTLGMVLSESAPNITAKILATDISRKVLGHAKAGQYDEARLKDVPQFMRKKYFTDSGGGRVTASPDLSRMIVFNYLNLMERWPFSGPFDFIFCRNVMIYFDKETQERLVNRFYDVLEPGGVLFTGHSESLTGIKHKFKYAQPTIYMKA